MADRDQALKRSANAAFASRLRSPSCAVVIGNHRTHSVTNIPDFVGDLRSAEPALDRVLDRHMADYNAFLPHVFMADVARSLCETGPTDAGRAMLGIIADHFERGDRDVRSVVLASFLETLDVHEPSHRAIIDALPPTLAAAREHIEDIP